MLAFLCWLLLCRIFQRVTPFSVAGIYTRSVPGLLCLVVNKINRAEKAAFYSRKVVPQPRGGVRESGGGKGV